MRPVKFPPEEIIALFKDRKVLTKEQVLKACGCKTGTFWKALVGHGHLTSYNFNAKYYTLLDIPTFDEFGLWSYRQARFSQWGSLSQTLIEMVKGSAAGCVARDLSAQLGVQAAPELSRLHKQERICRGKVGHTFVYVAFDERMRSAQLRARQQMKKVCVDVDLPAPELTIAVLVDLVQHPETDPSALSRRLRRRKIPVTQKIVQAIFEHYQLKKKKRL